MLSYASDRLVNSLLARAAGGRAGRNSLTWRVVGAGCSPGVAVSGQRGHMTAAPTFARQLPLLHCVESDDLYLQQRPDILWYTLLATVDWGKQFASVGAQYYEALWQFNAAQARSRAERCARTAQANPETEEEATMRLLFDRATMREDAPILEGDPPEEFPLIHVNPATIAPGVVPVRLAGRRPKCFFALFKSFVAMAVK